MRKLQSLYLLLFIVSPHIYAQQLFTDTVQLSQVTVTAEKRSQRIIEIPASISSISASRVESEKVKSLRNLTGTIPNFYMPEYGSKLSSPIYLRGIGSRTESSSVAIYMDNVPYFEKSSSTFDLEDIERVEVLRGPQGTLYGRNSIGGLINVITRKPGNTMDTRLSVDFGNYGYMRYRFSHNQPLINEKLAVMVGGGYTERDGYFKNEFNGSQIGNEFIKDASVKILFKPVKPLMVCFKFGGTRDFENGYPYGLRKSDQDNFVTINYNHKSVYKRDKIDNSLNVSYLLGDVKVSLISSYQYVKDGQDLDQDFTNRDIYNVTRASDQNVFTQELNFTNFNSESLDVTGGIFYFSQKALRDNLIDYGLDKMDLKLKGLGYDKITNDHIWGMAGFGQVTLKKIAGFFDLTMGLRYDHEDDTYKYKYLTYSDAGAISQVADTSITNRHNQILPKVALRLILSNNISIFGVVSKGYKSGGFNTTFERQEDMAYGPESSWNYEVGLKSFLIPNKLTLNTSFFYTDWDNQQVSQTIPSGRGYMFKNAGKTYSKGFEVDFNYTPIKAITLGGSLGVTEARYVSFKKSPNLTDTVNYKGNSIPYVPRHTLSAYAMYKYNLNSDFCKELNLSVFLQGIGKNFFNDQNSQWQNAFLILNGRVGLLTKFGEVSLWAKNITEEKYMTYVFTTSGKWYAQTGNPLTFGVSLSVKISGK